MTRMLDCARAEELLSDYHDGVLVDPERAEVQLHLATCDRCNELLNALAEVVSALRTAPDLDPALDLARRAADAAWGSAPAHRPSARGLLRFPQVTAVARAVFAVPEPVLVRGLAAALAMAVTGGVMVAQSVVGPPVRAANRVVERTVNVGAYLAERKDHLVEDFRLLRVVIGTAFEGRLDRVNDRVDDYRRLMERRRGPAAAPDAPQPDAKAPSLDGAELRRDASRAGAQTYFLNSSLAPPVTRDMTSEARRRIGRPMTRPSARRTA
jgi:anti-sigma factor RsiW